MLNRTRFFMATLTVGAAVQIVFPLDSGSARAAEQKPLPEPIGRSVSFEADVLPLLKARCLECHGDDEPEAGLRLTSRRSLLRGGDSGEPAVQLRKSAESFLIKVVAGHERDVKMPPEGAALTSPEIAILRAWIDQGLDMPAGSDDDDGTDHWSFQPVSTDGPPELDDAFIANGIDAFILQKLRENDLKPSPRAERRTLIRRLLLVLHGLPPTPAQVDAFVADERPDAWQRLVNEALDSPRYGERWARHWLDLIRFGETYGFETNRERPNAWPYRDWVIAAFNNDKPYDDFVRQQIAGDALGEPIGTGFLVAGPHDLVKSPDINLTLMQRQDELSDLINTTGTAFLGLTLGCARCHNHKFDPVTQTDFYSVQGIFAGVQHADRALPLTDDQKQQLDALERQIAELRQKLAPFIPNAGERLRSAVTAHHNVEQFAPVAARFVRFTVLATNSSQPCLDELEVFSGDKNVALASSGSKATCSSSLPGYPIHKLEHINDGQSGNGRSWISNESGAGWVQIELPRVENIQRIEWARDRERKFGDRVATKYRIEAAIEPGKWQLIASSEDREPFGNGPAKEPAYQFDTATAEQAAQGRIWLAQLESVQRQQALTTTSRTVYAGTFSQPGPTHRLYRGEPQQPREEVPPGTIAAISPLTLAAGTPEQERRLAFANWVVRPDNPLTARVIVNRLWQFQFGTGLVATPSDFGANGIPPSHPELLDWLARELVEHDWSLKHVQRLILASSTWRQDSRPRPDAQRIDADSRLLWRFPPRRLEAEAIRDSILAVSGKLNLQAGGPGFSGFEVEMENVRHFHPKTKFTDDDFRRMIYMTKVRQEQESVFGVFDCPDASQVMPLRSRSTTPMQAFSLLNSAFVLEQSQFFAARLSVEPDENSAVEKAFALCFSRPPSNDERHLARDFLRESTMADFARAMLNASEFLFVP